VLIIQSARLQSKPDLQLGFDFNNRFTLVRPAFRADAVGDVKFTTGFANHQFIQGQRIMCAAFVTAGGRVSTFWQRPHRLYSSANSISYEVE
jgi:hypothetical protein